MKEDFAEGAEHKPMLSLLVKVCNELLAAAAALKKEDPKSEMEPIEMVLLQPNASGSAVLHMALKAGPMPQAQAAALGCLRHLKPAQVQTAYMHARKKVAGVSVVEKEKIAETPLLLAVSSHAHAVVKHLLEEPMSVSVNECNAAGETAMIRCLSGVTRESAALDATIFKSANIWGTPLFALGGILPKPMFSFILVCHTMTYINCHGLHHCAPWIARFLTWHGDYFKKLNDSAFDTPLVSLRLLMDAGAKATPDSANGSGHPLLAVCK
eukprot:1159320-Pelagomonas_calceolata.AAC.1